MKWRRERDSNPRYPFTEYTRLESEYSHFQAPEVSITSALHLYYWFLIGVTDTSFSVGLVSLLSGIFVNSSRSRLIVCR
ncbi:hypothetical protein DSTSK_18710 [Desulforhabdus sp. TSK]|nr:hypothetical protein DSTSK_18710 [Desulforhabdus sp. TSK]